MRSYIHFPETGVPIYGYDFSTFSNLLTINNSKMIQKARNSSDHPEFGKFISREISRLHIKREDFRDSCHMNQDYLDAIKKGSIIMR